MNQPNPAVTLFHSMYLKSEDIIVSYRVFKATEFNESLKMDWMFENRLNPPNHLTFFRTINLKQTPKVLHISHVPTFSGKNIQTYAYIFNIILCYNTILYYNIQIYCSERVFCLGGGRNRIDFRRIEIKDVLCGEDKYIEKLASLVLRRGCLIWCGVFTC